MENLKSRVHSHIQASIDTKLALLECLSDQISAAGKKAADCLKGGSKILACGNGGSAADAQHFSAELLGRYEKDRPSLAAMALSTDTSTLTAIANDYSYDRVFARQIEALGKPGDILLAISTSGNSANVITAIEAAHLREMNIIALTGKGGGKITNALRKNDLHLCVPANVVSRIQECHVLILHCLCDLIDMQLIPYHT